MVTTSEKPTFSGLLKNNPRFRNLYISQAISTLGDWFTTIALMLVVYDVTQSGLMVSLSLICKALPVLLIGPFAGAFIDRSNRKMIMIASQFLNGILVLFLMFAQSHIWTVFVVNVLTSIVSNFFSPARQSILPQVVEKNELTIANTLSSTTWGVMSMLGASFGGVISSFFGVNTIFIIDSATFFIALLIVWVTDLPTQETKIREVHFLQDIKEGFLFVKKCRIILVLIIVGASWGIVGGAYSVLLPFFGMGVFDSGQTGVGLLYGIQGLGVILGGFAVKMFVTDNDYRMKTSFGWAYLAQGLFFVFFALSPNLVLGLLFLLFMRIAGGVIIPLDATLIQKFTPQHLIGKVFTLHGSIYTSIMQISMFATGLLLKKMSPPTVGVLLGSVCVIASVSWLVMFYLGRLEEGIPNQALGENNQTNSAQ